MKSLILATYLVLSSAMAPMAYAQDSSAEVPQDDFGMEELGEAFKMPAHVLDVADTGTIEVFVEAVYPRISSFAPMQTQESINNRLRYFVSSKAFAAFAKQRTDDKTLELVYTKGGMSIDQIISKISVRDLEDGNWQAEFVSRRLTMSPDGENSTCFSVRVDLIELPVQPATNIVAINEISNKPMKVECPKI